MSFPDEEMLSEKLHSRTFLDTISTVPIKKRRLFFCRSPSPPPEIQSSLNLDFQVPPVEGSDILASSTVPSIKGLSESGLNSLADGVIPESPKQHDFNGQDCNDCDPVGLQLAGIFSDGKLVSFNGVVLPLEPVGRVDKLMPDENSESMNITKETSVAEKLSGNTDLLCKETFENFHIRDSFSRGQEPLELQDSFSRKKCVVSGSNTVVDQISLHRSHWDLNRTMDAWEGSSSDSAGKSHYCDVNGWTDFGGLLGREAHPSPSASLSLSGEPKSLSSDLLLHNRETEAYLDLRLEPLSMPESHFPCCNAFSLGKVNSFNAMKIISSSTKPSNLCEPCKSVPLVEQKTGIHGLENLVLKPIKSEYCEMMEASSVPDCHLTNSASDAALKLELLEDRDRFENHAAANESGVSHINMCDLNLLQSTKIPLEAVDDRIMASNTNCVSVSMAHVIQGTASMLQAETGFDEGREFILRKHDGFSIKPGLEKGLNTNIDSKYCEQNDLAADILQVSSTYDILAEKVSHEKAEGVSCLSLSEIDSKTEPGEGNCLNLDTVEFKQTTNDEQCYNECKPGNADFEKDGCDEYGFEDGELRDNLGSNLIVQIEKGEVVYQRGLVDVPVAMSSTHEHVNLMTLESPEVSKDPGTVESSSVTGDSSARKTCRTARKLSRDSLRKMKIDRDPTSANNDYIGEDANAMEDFGAQAKSSFPLSGETKRDAFDRKRSGRIINLKLTSSRNLNHVLEGPLSSRIERENSKYKILPREKCQSDRSRDENYGKRSYNNEDRKQRGWACGKHGSGSKQMRIRERSDSPHSRVRDEQRLNQFDDRTFDFNCIMPDQIQGRDDIHYSRSAEMSINSMSDTRIPRVSRISRKLTNELQTRKQMPGKMLDRSRPHTQFDRTDRIPVHHRKRLSLSPVRRRCPQRLSPANCSPRFQAMSPSQWSPQSTPDNFNRQSRGVQHRSGVPILMHESMNSTRQPFTDEFMVRTRRPDYGPRFSNGMMEVASSREFRHKMQTRQVPGEYCGSSFDIEREYAIGRRYNDVHESAHYLPRCMPENDDDDDAEIFSFQDEEARHRSYRYHTKGNQEFNARGSSQEAEGRIKNRLCNNTSRRFRQIEGQHQHEDEGFRHHQEEQGWNDSGFHNVRPRGRRC